MASEAQLQQDLQAAMRAREMQKVYVLRGLVAAIKNLKVEKLAHELPDADISSLVRKEINKRVEALATLRSRTSRDREQNRAEKAILESYLPAQLGSAELEATIKSLAGELGTTRSVRSWPSFANVTLGSSTASSRAS